MTDHTAIWLETRFLSLVRNNRELFSKVNIQISPGTIFQIKGSNGTGKTSLLRLLAGVSRLGYTGQLLHRGEAIEKRRTEFNEQLLYIGHRAAVKSSLTASENLRWHQTLGGEVNGDIDEALFRVGLYGYEDLLCGNLSAGQQRRVALARLYLTAAKLWILDEPFTAIDQQGVAELETLFVSHARNGGMLILATHQTVNIDYPVQTLMLGGPCI